MRQAIAANPGAMADHFLWNARLIPEGLQLMLFDRISGTEEVNPDYLPVTTRSRAALAGGLLLALFTAVGLLLLWRDRVYWWDGWIRERAWGWVALGSLSVAALVVALMQRPRPSYLFALSVALLALIGMCAMAFARRFPRLQHLAAAPPLLAVVLLLAVPAHYDEDYRSPQTGGGTPLKLMVSRLDDFREDLTGSQVRLAVIGPINVGCNYINGSDPCTGVPPEDSSGNPTLTVSPRWLREQDIDFIYADETSLADQGARDSLARLEHQGWERLAPVPADRGQWVFLRHPATATPEDPH
jgi:hypothetical protein